MKKGLILTIVIVILVLFIILWFQHTYNKMVNREEVVKKEWSQVQNVYQRRLDLIPNLVNTVKGAANFEQNTLKMVMEARAKATQVNIDPSRLDAQSIQRFQAAQDGISSSLSRLMAVVENYPDLKASKNFLELQAQLEGTENRIAVERKNFNDAVNLYNSYLRQWPQNMLAGMYGFQQKGYFEATKGAETPPAVQF